MDGEASAPEEFEPPADFSRSAAAALREVSDEPFRLVTGEHIAPRAFLATLAEAAADWPETPGEVWYGEIMQGCFWALLRQAPFLDDDPDGQGLALAVQFAMTSMDRGGHHAAADLCETALAYMASLPAWSEAGIGFGPAEGQTSVAFKPTIGD